MHVMTRITRARRATMAVFTIDAENNITALADTEPAQAAAETSVQIFASQKELAQLAADWPATRLVETWNGFASVVPFDHLKPVRRFTDRNIAVKRIWQAIQKLAPVTQTNTVAPQGADSAPSANASTNSTTPQPRRPKAAKKSKASAVAKGVKPKQRKPSHKGAREGSKKAEILALIQRPKGATLAEIMKATGWQAHSVRGFVSGTLGKRMGLIVESARREDGQRVYRLADVRREA
jgi:Protein of unknown function (DUF3489)